jgi:hypothetical protein
MLCKYGRIFSDGFELVCLTSSPVRKTECIGVGVPVEVRVETDHRLVESIPLAPPSKKLSFWVYRRSRLLKLRVSSHCSTARPASSLVLVVIILCAAPEDFLIFWLTR